MKGIRLVAMIGLVLLVTHTAGADSVRAHDERDEKIPATGEQWFARGNSLYDESRYRESVAAFERAMQLQVANAPLGAWNVARGYARLGNRKQALRWLAHARDMGFHDAKALRADPAMDPYRSDPEFRKLVSLVRHESGEQPVRVSLML